MYPIRAPDICLYLGFRSGSHWGEVERLLSGMSGVAGWEEELSLECPARMCPCLPSKAGYFYPEMSIFSGRGVYDE